MSTASITVFSRAGKFTIEGSEREIEQIANQIADQFKKQGGAWLSNGEWTAYVPASTPVNVDLAGELLPGIEAISITSVRR